MRKGERTKKMIIEKSLPLFNQKGYVASTVVDVLNETGLKRGGLYNHFGSRDELAINIFHHALEVMRPRFSEALFSKKPVAERLLDFIHVFINLYDNVPFPGGCPILNVAVESDATHPTLKKEAIQAMGNLYNAIENVLKEGVENGEFLPHTNTEQVTTILFASAEGALMMSRLNKDKKYLDQVLNFLNGYIQSLQVER